VVSSLVKPLLDLAKVPKMTNVQVSNTKAISIRGAEICVALGLIRVNAFAICRRPS
jgi:hypothetical protein